MAETKKNFYTQDVYQECRDRIDKLQANTQPQWGAMTSAQMLAHCSEILEVANGKPLKNTPFIAKLFKGMIRKMVLSDKPYPKNSQTHPQYKQAGNPDFDEEKSRLLNAMDTAFKRSKQEIEKIKHPLFGAMSFDEKGWAMYKHLDHHLSQFGV